MTTKLTFAEKVALAGGISLIALAMYVHFCAGFTGDKMTYLGVALRYLQGEKLYTDIFEVSLPLIVWIYSISVSLGLLFQIEDSHALMLLAFAVTAVSISVSMLLMQNHSQFAHHKKRQIQRLFLLCYVTFIYAAPVIFFDRESIFFILVLPYILRFMPSLSGVPLNRVIRLLIGFMAGVGVCIKPQCALVFAGLQLIYLLRKRNLAILVSVENLIVYLIGTLYVIAIWQLYPEYIHVIFPMAMKTYAACNRNFSGIMTNGTATLFMVAVTLVEFKWRKTSPYRRDIYYLMAVCALFVGYVIVNNGWGYTYLPLNSTILLMTGFVLWEFLFFKEEAVRKELPAKPYMFGVNACFINLSVNVVWTLMNLVGIAILANVTVENAVKDPILTEFFVGLKDMKDKSFNKEAEAFVKDHNIKTFGMINLGFGMWTNIARHTDAKMVTRFDHLWMLPKFVHSDAAFAERNKWIPEYIGNAYADDLNNKKPDIVFVDINPRDYTIDQNVDLIQFVNHGRFPEAWSHYHLVKTIDLCVSKDGTYKSYGCKHDIYQRGS